MPKNFRQSFTPTSYRTLLGVLVLVFVVSSGILVSDKTKAQTDPLASQNVNFNFLTEGYNFIKDKTTAWNPTGYSTPQPGYAFTTGSNASAGQYWYYKNPDGTYSVVWQNPDTKELLVKPQDISAAEFKAAQQASQNSPGVVGGYVYDALLRAFAWVCDLILYIFSYLVSLGGVLLDIAIAITSKLKFTQSQIVQAGWPIIRDLANMFFALILLVIAFATILRLESYGMKTILWRLVVAALLINFSLVIAGVIIDGSHVLTSFFLSNRFEIKGGGQTASISEAILNNLQVTSFWKTDPKSGNVFDPKSGNVLQGAGSTNSPGFMAIALNAILGIILMLVTAFVLLSAAILFLVRMVALWILLIFAPLAWLAMILPATRSMWNKWWNEFIKWVIFAPVYAFFIYLTVFLMSKNILLGNSAINEAVTQANSTWAASVNFIFNTFFQNFQIVVNYIILVIFMVAGLFFARQAGIHGAAGLYNATVSMRKSAGRGVSRWAAGGAKVPGADWLSKKVGPQKWAEKGWTRLAKVAQAPGVAKRLIAPMASPHVWARAWSEMQKRADESAFGKPAGSIVDTWQAIKKLSPSEFKKAISQEGKLAQLEHQRGVDRREREYAMAYKDEAQTVDAYQKATDPIDVEALSRRVGAFNGWNTLAIQEGWKEFDPDALREYWRRKFGDTADGARKTADLVAVALANGFYPAAGSIVWDAKLGRNRFAKDSEEHYKVYATKMGQLEPQGWARTSHPNTFVGFTVKTDPKTSEKYPEYYLHNFAKKWIQKEMTQLHINQTNRFQPRTGAALTEDKIFKEIHDLNETFAEELNRVAVIKGQRPPAPPRPEPSSEQSPERL